MSSNRFTEILSKVHSSLFKHKTQDNPPQHQDVVSKEFSPENKHSTVSSLTTPETSQISEEFSPNHKHSTVSSQTPEFKPDEIKIEEPQLIFLQFPYCKTCNPELYYSGQIQSVKKTFQCNCEGCQDWFCAKHFTEHKCICDSDIRGYQYTSTGEGGMKLDKFEHKIGYARKDNDKKRL